MSVSVRDDGTETVESVAGSRDFAVRGGGAARQLKWGLSQRPGDSGRGLGEPEVLSHLTEQDRSASLRLTRRPRLASAEHAGDLASDTVQSELTAVLGHDHDGVAASPTSPFCLMEGLGSLGLSNGAPGFHPVLQRQVERQLLADPEMMRCVLGSPLVQCSLCTSRPQLTRQLILSNPEIQQVTETNPEVGDLLDNTDVIPEELELVRNPDMIEEVTHNEDTALDNSQPQQKNRENITNDSYGLQKTDADIQEQSLKLCQMHIGVPTVVTATCGKTEGEREATPPFITSHCADPVRELTATTRDDPNPQCIATTGMQALLQEIMASPGLMESLLSGPYISSLLNCLSHNPDLAAQMLLSHPLFSGNPHLKQQMRQQLPLFLQQMQSPEMLSALLNPRAMEAVLQIQQGLQTLAAEAPALIPVAGIVNSGANVTAAPELASDSVLNSQSENGPQVATVTEQLQQFVKQMLQALANTNNGVPREETEFQEELEQLSSLGFRDTQANLQALVNTGGDLATAIQHLLSL